MNPLIEPVPVSTVKPRLPITSPSENEGRALLLAGLCALISLWLVSGGMAQALPVADWVDALLLPPDQLALDAVLWRFALLPQLAMALLAGSALGIAGVLLQQGLRNPLVHRRPWGSRGAVYWRWH